MFNVGDYVAMEGSPDLWGRVHHIDEEEVLYIEWLDEVWLAAVRQGACRNVMMYGGPDGLVPHQMFDTPTEEDINELI